MPSKYSPQQKLAAVLRVLKGEASQTEAARELGVHPTLVSDWKEKFLKEAPGIFTSQAQQDETRKQLAEYERIIGRMTIENEFLKKVHGHLQSQ